MKTTFQISHENGFFTVHWDGFDSQPFLPTQLLSVLTHWAAQLPAKREDFPSNIAWRAFQVKSFSTTKQPKRHAPAGLSLKDLDL